MEYGSEGGDATDPESREAGEAVGVWALALLYGSDIRRQLGIPLREILGAVAMAGFDVDVDAELRELVAAELITEDEDGMARVRSSRASRALSNTLAHVFAYTKRSGGESQRERGEVDPTQLLFDRVAKAVLRPTAFDRPQSTSSSPDGGAGGGGTGEDVETAMASLGLVAEAVESPTSPLTDGEDEQESRMWDPYRDAKRKSMLTAIEVMACAVSTVLANTATAVDDKGHSAQSPEGSDPVPSARATALATAATALITRYTDVCPRKESPWAFSGLNKLATIATTEDIVHAAGPIREVDWQTHPTDLTWLQLRCRRDAMSPSRESSRSSTTGSPRERHRFRDRITSADSIVAFQARLPAELYKQRLRDAGPLFRPGATYVTELVWRLAAVAHDTSAAATRSAAAWSVLVPAVRLGILMRRAWAPAALMTLADTLFDAGRYRYALYFATVALKATDKPKAPAARAGGATAAAAARPVAPILTGHTCSSDRIAACRITAEASKLCLGLEYADCIKEAISAFKTGLTATCPAEVRARARFRVASMHLWGGEHEEAITELQAMHAECVVSRDVDELMLPAPGVTAPTAATVSLALAELCFADDDGAAAATYANHAIQVLEASRGEHRELADLATAFVARLARAEDRLQEAMGLIASTSRQSNTSTTIAFEAALIHLAMGEFRLARRCLARLKTNILVTDPISTFWALPLAERWPNISIDFVEIALLSAHENVLAVGPAGWQDDDECNGCTLCHCDFSFLNRKHHCRSCGGVVCDDCSQHREYLSHPSNPSREASRHAMTSPTIDPADVPCTLQRICDACKDDFIALESASTMSHMTAAY
eukprot:m.174385 g.174385  ORF g.174385 m.174385 type:complete len:836 (+) comp13825_c0_seq1:143-2650(+)